MAGLRRADLQTYARQDDRHTGGSMAELRQRDGWPTGGRVAGTPAAVW